MNKESIKRRKKRIISQKSQKKLGPFLFLDLYAGGRGNRKKKAPECPFPPPIISQKGICQHFAYMADRKKLLLKGGDPIL